MNDRRTGFLSRLWREKPLGTIGGIIILILILVSIFADFLAPYRHGEMNLASILKGPSAAHLLGADHLGRDLLSRLIHGARISLLVGFAATTLNVVVAVLIGGTSGFLGGKSDLVVQRFVDAWMSFPGLLLLLTVMSIADRGLAQFIVVLGIAGGIPASRVVRGAVLGVKENAYFQAAEVIGCSTGKTLVRHVLPNVAAPIIGGMLSREGRQYMEMAPRLALWPGLCLTIVVYSLNMFGDAVRDLLDPRLRGGGGRLGAGS